MGFGLLMQDNTPVDLRYRGLSYVPGGPYYPERRAFRACPKGMVLSRTGHCVYPLPGVSFGYVPGGPYYPGLGYVPGGPYFPARRFRGYGIPPAQAARVPQYGHHSPHDLPGVPENFGEDTPSGGMYDQPIGPVFDPTQLQTQQNTGWTKQDTVDVVKTVLDATGKVIGAVTNTGQTYYQGSCGAGAVYVPGRGCVATSSGSNTGLLVAGAVGLGLVALLLSRH